MNNPLEGNSELPWWGTLLILIVVYPIATFLAGLLVEWIRTRLRRHRHDWVEDWTPGPRDRTRTCRDCGELEYFWDDCTTTASGWTKDRRR